MIWGRGLESPGGDWQLMVEDFSHSVINGFITNAIFLKQLYREAGSSQAVAASLSKRDTARVIVFGDIVFAEASGVEEPLHGFAELVKSGLRDFHFLIRVGMLLIPLPGQLLVQPLIGAVFVSLDHSGKGPTSFQAGDGAACGFGPRRAIGEHVATHFAQGALKFRF